LEQLGQFSSPEQYHFKIVALNLNKLILYQKALKDGWKVSNVSLCCTTLKQVMTILDEVAILVINTFSLILPFDNLSIWIFNLLIKVLKKIFIFFYFIMHLSYVE
jgi:hypothetical protein